MAHGGDTHFCHTGRGGQTFYVKYVMGDDVDGQEEDVSIENMLVSKASKLSAVGKIFREP